MSNQYLTFDVTKANQVQQLIVGRQGDNALKTVSMLFWDGERNRPYDLTGKQVYFEALKPDNSHIVDYAGITITDPKYGLATYAFNEQVFTVQGMMQQAFFKISETNASGKVTTDSALEVSINVLSNSVEFGIKSEDYLSEYDRLIADVEKKFDDYANAVSGNIAEVSKAHDDIQALMKQISDNNIVTINEFNLTKDEVQSARTNTSGKTYPSLGDRINDEEASLINNMNAKISQISSVPETFANLAALQSAYPNGKTGLFVTADNGHKYIWANGSWSDAGIYQSVGIANGSITSEKVSDLNKSAFIYGDGYSDNYQTNIDTVNKVFSVKNRYINYGNHSVFIADVQIDLSLYVRNIIYFNPSTNTLGSKEFIGLLSEDDIYIGIIDRNFLTIELKATYFSIDGQVARQFLTNRFVDRNVYLYGTATLNIDNSTVSMSQMWVNYDFGDGDSAPAAVLDVSVNKSIYFDLIDKKFKTQTKYSQTTDSQLYLGYFDTTNPEKTFFANFSRVLIVKNGITYNVEDYKAKSSTLSNVYMATFGDSITSDQVSGTGTQIMNALGAKKTGNFATGWSTGSDWHTGNTNVTTVTLAVPNNTDTNDNVLSNQVRRALQYTTTIGQPITWTHPVDGTFLLDASIGAGLGNTDKMPSIIYIAISTNDGKNDSVPVVDDTEAVFAQNYKDLTRNSLASGLRWAIETLQSAYPNAKIFVASPIQTGSTSGNFSFSNTRLKRDIVKKVANFTSVYFIDSFSESGFSRLKNKTWTDDGVHPSSIGKLKLVEYVANEIRKKL